MFEQTGSTGYTKIVTDSERQAEVRKINGPPRGDVDEAMDGLLLRWEHREITFDAVRTTVSDFSMGGEGELVETRRPLLVDIQALGAGDEDRVDGTVYPPYAFRSAAEVEEATTLAIDGFIAWHFARREQPASVDVLTHDRAPQTDRLLGELHTARIKTVSIPTLEG